LILIDSIALKPIVEILEDKCKICYACVRECPVKAIKVTSSGQIPVIVADRCIGCGTCVNVCSPKAIAYRSDKEIVKELLANHSNVVASIDPTIASEFPDITDYRKFARMLKRLGFKQAYEVSFGVDLVAQQYKKLLDNFRGKYYITANCPVVVAYIEKFHPEFVNNIAPIVSPMIAMSRVIRKKIDGDVKIVHLGPCIGEKDDGKLYDSNKSVDAVLTFLELRELFDELNISESTLEYSHITEPLGYTGSLYPISNGFIQAADISEDLLENIMITGDGRNSMVHYMKAFEKNIDAINSHFNMFYCKGCIMGPGTSKGLDRLERRKLVVEYSNKRIKSLDKSKWENNVAKYSDIDFSRSFNPNDQRLPEPQEERIIEILHSIEKNRKEDEVDCGACGYSTCRDFATAVAKGLTIPEMCITFSFQNQQNYIKSLKASNEKLAHIQAALKESERKARTEHEAAKEASETTTSMLQKLRAGIVFLDKNLKIIQTNNSFINILGDEAKEISEVVPGLIGADIKTLLPYAFHNIVNYVLNTNEEVTNRDVQTEKGLLNISAFPIKQGKIAGVIVRDLYQPEVRKEEIILRVSDVIDKNLEMVQKIGFLLGEGASETEKMLNSIIQSYKPKEGK
jgi:iron only hydrogenase large subunit-like protein